MEAADCEGDEVAGLTGQRAEVHLRVVVDEEFKLEGVKGVNQHSWIFPRVRDRDFAVKPGGKMLLKSLGLCHNRAAPVHRVLLSVVEHHLQSRTTNRPSATLMIPETHHQSTSRIGPLRHSWLYHFDLFRADVQHVVLFPHAALTFVEGDWKPAAARADAVVETPSRRNVEFEGADFPDRHAPVLVVVKVREPRLHHDLAADVVRGNLVHVRADPGNFYQEAFASRSRTGGRGTTAARRQDSAKQVEVLVSRKKDRTMLCES